jgi:hypothetical protein
VEQRDVDGYAWVWNIGMARPRAAVVSQAGQLQPLASPRLAPRPAVSARQAQFPHLISVIFEYEDAIKPRSVARC